MVTRITPPPPGLGWRDSILALVTFLTLMMMMGMRVGEKGKAIPSHPLWEGHEFLIAPIEYKPSSVTVILLPGYGITPPGFFFQYLI